MTVFNSSKRKIFCFFLILCSSMLTFQQSRPIDSTLQDDSAAVLQRSEHEKQESNIILPSYQYKTEILLDGNQGFMLSPAIEQFALLRHGYLNQSMYFDTHFVKNKTRSVSRQLHKKKPIKSETGRIVNVFTCDGIELACTYFDRGSDNLVIVGSGFTNRREILSPFVSMFHDYDVVLFDFRGHGYQPFNCIDPSTFKTMAKMVCGVDQNLATLGVDEEKDVFAVVDFFKNKKKYNNVFGVSICYSSFIFLKAQALRPGLFDKIALDGCWLSVPLMIEKMKKDLARSCTPQKGGYSQVWPFNRLWFQNLCVFLAKNIFGFKLDTNISIIDYLKKIKDTPLLYFYGKDDLMVSRDEFALLWENSLHQEKAAIITSNPHVMNHFKQKELYKFTCDLFFDLPFDEFSACISDINLLTKHYEKKLKESAKACTTFGVS